MNRVQYTRYYFTCMMVLALAACANNPFKVAQTPDEKIWVVLKSYNHVLKDEVLPAMRDEGIPVEVRRAMGDANRRGTPAVVTLSRAIGEYYQAKAEYEAGLTQDGPFADAVETLAQHIDAVQAIIDDFNTQLAKGKP